MSGESFEKHGPSLDVEWTLGNSIIFLLQLICNIKETRK